MHTHLASRGVALLLIILAALIIVVCWPSKSQTK
jgi:hypothetical protein